MAAFTRQQREFFNSGLVIGSSSFVESQSSRDSLNTEAAFTQDQYNSEFYLCAVHLIVVGCLYIKGQKKIRVYVASHNTDG